MKFEVEQMFSSPGEPITRLSHFQKLEQPKGPFNNIRFCGYTGGKKFVTDKTEREIAHGSFQGESPDGKYVFHHFDKEQYLQVFVPYNPSEHGELAEWYERGEEVTEMFNNPSYHAIHIHPSLSETTFGKGEIHIRVIKDQVHL